MKSLSRRMWLRSRALSATSGATPSRRTSRPSTVDDVLVLVGVMVQLGALSGSAAPVARPVSDVAVVPDELHGIGRHAHGGDGRERVGDFGGVARARRPGLRPRRSAVDEQAGGAD